MPPSSSSSPFPHHHKPPKRQDPNPSSSSSLCCHHFSPAATLDLLILLLVLFSFSFLVASSLSHLLRSLSQTLTLILPPPFTANSLLLLSLSFLLAKTSRLCSRKCANPRCRRLKKALEFDVQIQTEDCVKEKGKEWKEIEDLPWKGGQQGRNPDYEVLRARCGCPITKLEAWGPKRGRHKRSMVNLGLKGPTDVIL